MCRIGWLRAAVNRVLRKKTPAARARRGSALRLIRIYLTAV